MDDEETLKVLSQVLFDPELTDFHELEGAPSLNTLTYFLQYCGMEPQNVEIPALLKTMENLRKDEASLHDLRKQTVFSNELREYANTIVDRLGLLDLNESLLLPGGWLNSNGGHAIIYQFVKTDQGLLFTIHNSGAGIEHHEKTSSTHKELYYPTHSYLIPNDVSMTDLPEFIEELTIPSLPNHPDRMGKLYPTDLKTFDGDLLYYRIKLALGFLKAKFVPVSQTTPDALTTASQLSGTCSQRVIHQFLKQQFTSHSDYQRFIFKFKMHAIRDYIDILTRIGSCSDAQKKLIRSAIANTLRLAKTNGLFSEDEQLVINQQATEFNQLVNALLVQNIKVSLNKIIPQKAPKTEVSISLINQPLSYKANHSATFQQTPYEEILPIRNQTLLTDELSIIINHCKERYHTSPKFVLEQIERTVLSLSLEPEAYQDCDIPTLLKCLSQLQELYQSTYYMQVGSEQFPRQFVILTSLLTIQQRLLEHQASVRGLPTFDYFKVLLTQCSREPWVAWSPRDVGVIYL